MKKSKQSKTLLGIFIIFVIVFLNALGPFFQLQQIATMGLLPILAGIAFLYDGKSIHTKNKEFIIFLMILLLSFTTIYYFKGFDEFTTTLSSLFGAVVAAYIAIGLTKKVDFSLFFHIGYIFSILTLFIIMISN